METNFEKILRLLSESSVSQNDQEIFLESCLGVVDENLELLAELFVESPDWIEKVVENFKEKREAAFERNMKRWHDIVDDEVSMLKDAQKMEDLRLNLGQAI